MKHVRKIFWFEILTAFLIVLFLSGGYFVYLCIFLDFDVSVGWRSMVATINWYLFRFIILLICIYACIKYIRKHKNEV